MEKAVGLEPKKESEQDSKPDIQQLDKQIDVAELFKLGPIVSAKINAVTKDIEKGNTRLSSLTVRKGEIDLLLKPLTRESKKIPGFGNPTPPSRTERKNLRAERKAIVRQIFLVKEEIETNEQKLSQLTGRVIRREDINLLYDKANAGHYLKKNKHLIKAKMLKSINTFRKTADTSTIARIRSLARSNEPNSLQNFKQEFGPILEAVDLETFILCSGLLANTLYQAARLTILSKSASFKGELEELVMPAEE